MMLTVMEARRVLAPDAPAEAALLSLAQLQLRVYSICTTTNIITEIMNDMQGQY
jgi:hypothetical protein